MPRRTSRGTPGAEPAGPAAGSLSIGQNNEGIASTGPNARNFMLRVEGGTTYRITRLPSKGKSPPEPWRQQPSQLLLAQHQIVPFTGRGEQLEELAAWRDDPDGPAAGLRLLHGPGGRGKTRLALELAGTTRPPWRVWQAIPGSAGPGAWPVRSLGTHTLIIADYAERWPADTLEAFLRDLASRPADRRRVLLIARSAGTWWLSQLHELHKIGYRITKTSLDQLGETAGPGAGGLSDRQQAFLAARDSFAQALGLDDPEAAGLPFDLRDPSFGLTLTVHMAALAAVDAQVNGAHPPSDPQSLSAYLLDRERAHWEKLHAGGGSRRRIDADTMAQVVYLATLTGRLPRPAALSAVELADVESPSPSGKILKDHALAYPADAADSYLEPLYPDRLGEDFLALMTPGHQGLYPPDPWADAALPRLLSLAEDGSAPPWTRHALTVVIETARRWEHIATGYLYPLLLREPQLALAAGGAAVAALSRLPGIDMAVLEAIDAAFPGPHIDLNAGMAALAERLGDHLLANEHDLAERARIYRDISHRMRRAELDELGIRPAEQAVHLYRDLAQSNPMRFQEPLARALNLLGIHLELTDHPDLALAATEESAGMLRKLIDAGRADLAPTLGRVLANLSGRHALNPDQRLRTAEEAVTIGRRCLAETPDADDLELAGALENLAILLREHGRAKEAVTAAREALTIRRDQALKAPEIYSPDLARTLRNLADALSEDGQVRDSVTVTAEAADLYRRLAAADPSGQEHFAWQLIELAERRGQVGQYGEAARAVREAVEMFQTLAEADPAGHQPSVAKYLCQLGFYYDNSGEPEKALAVTAESVDAYRRLAQTDPVRFQPDMALAVRNLAVLAAQADLNDHAVTAAAEAVTLYRRLYTADPAQGQHDLADSLYLYGQYALRADHIQASVECLVEAVELFRTLAEADPAQDQLQLAYCLHILGMSYAESGEAEKAITALTEAVTLYRHLTASDPETIEPALGEAIDFLASLHNETGI